MMFILCQEVEVSYSYKFSRDVNFEVFTVNCMVISEIFLLKILLAKLSLASIGEQDTLEWQCLTLARDNGMLLL